MIHWRFGDLTVNHIIMLSHTQADDWKGHPDPIHEHCHVLGLLHSAASPWGGFQTQVAKKGTRLEQEGVLIDKYIDKLYLTMPVIVLSNILI